MAFLIPLVLFIGLFLLVSSRIGQQSRGLSGGRVLARGLVLSASSISSGEQTVGLQRFELRQMVLDVEIPGKDPYEVSVTPLIPRFVEGRPGAALDLAVNPRRPGDIVILGPAGSSAWLPAAPWLTGSSVAMRGGRFVIAGVVAMIPTLFALGVVAAAVNKHATPASTHGTTHPLSAACDSATKCCKVIGASSCTQFATMADSACVKAYQTELTTATKARKHCQ